MGATPHVRRFAQPFRPLRGQQGTSPGIPHRRGRSRGPSRPGHSRRANVSRSPGHDSISTFCRALGPHPLCYYASISDGTPGERRFAVEESAARGRSVSRLNVLIAVTAAIIGLIYGYDLGSIASALLFLVPAFDLNTFMTSVVTSAVVLGQLLSALFVGAHLQHHRVQALSGAGRARLRGVRWSGSTLPSVSPCACAPRAAQQC